MQRAAGKVTPPGPAPNAGGLACAPPTLLYWLRGSGLNHRERSKQVQTQMGGGGATAATRQDLLLTEGPPSVASRRGGGLSLASSRRTTDPSGWTGDRTRPSDSTYAPTELQHTYCAIIISYLAGASPSAAHFYSRCKSRLVWKRCVLVCVSQQPALTPDFACVYLCV